MNIAGHHRRSLLLVDLSNQLYKACWSYQNLTHDGEFTGGLYGVLMRISSAIRYTGATRVILCTDRKPYVRAQDYPEYKAGRKRKPDARAEELGQAVAVARQQVLTAATAIGLPIWGLNGFEADDLAAHAVRHYRHRWHTLWSLSNDDDLHQLFTIRHFQVLASTPDVQNPEGAKIHNSETFRLRLPGLRPDQYVEWLAMKGTHNDVEGIPGVGEKRALQALTTHPDNLLAYRRQWGELIERNVGLITLPHPRFPRDTRLPPFQPINLKNLLSVCDEFGFQSANTHILPGFTLLAKNGN